MKLPEWDWKEERKQFELRFEGLKNTRREQVDALLQRRQPDRFSVR